jgi:Fe-S-cluster-containing hydrogenase component 2
MKRIILDPSRCTGCRVCEAVCSLVNEGEFNPDKSRIHAVRTFNNGILRTIPVFCLQCEDPYCRSVCPVSAISRDDRRAVVVDENKCIGCKLCEIACPVGAITVRSDKGFAVKCNLCEGREEPQCAKYCFSRALQYMPDERAGVMKAREKSAKFYELQNREV